MREVRVEVERNETAFLVRLYHWPSGRTIEAEAGDINTARDTAWITLAESLKEPYRQFPTVIRC